jgi:predicted ATP-grasp superfamily ATP-dependent carboligase
MSSRYARPVVLPSILKSEQDAAEELTKLSLRLGEKAVLFPTGDSVVLAVSRHRTQLQSKYSFLMPDEDLTQKLVTKSGLAEIISNQRLPGPKTTFLSSLEEMPQALATVEYPALMKPVRSSSWYRDEIVRLIGVCKGLVCKDRDDLEAKYSMIAAVDPAVVLQEIIPGEDASLYYVCGYYNADSQLEAIFAGRKLRVTPAHFGSASFVESVYDPRLFEAATNLLTPLKYKGLFGVEFKLDPRDGVFKIIEVNVRYGLWDYLASRCGIDLAFLAYARETGLRYEPRKTYRTGVRWVSSRRDLDACLDYVREGSLSIPSWIKSALGETQHAVFASDDLLPSFREAQSILRWKLSGLKSRFGKS